MEQLAFAHNPPAQSHRRLDFEKAEVIAGIAPGTYFLHVTGSKPCINMEVSLSPLIYVTCPEYWGIEVIGSLPSGVCLERIGHYDKTIPLAGVIGSRGIEVQGATRSEKFEVPGGCCSGTAFRKDGPFPEK